MTKDEYVYPLPFYMGIIRVTRARSYNGKILPGGISRIYFPFCVMLHNSKKGEWYNGEEERAQEV